MALKDCPECSKPISTEADRCPHCCRPLNSAMSEIEVYRLYFIKRARLFFGVIGVGAILMMLWGQWEIGMFGIFCSLVGLGVAYFRAAMWK